MLLIFFTCLSWNPLLVSGNVFKIFQLFHLHCLMFCLHLSWFFPPPIGSSLSDKVQQSPPDIHKSSEKEVKIQCSHSIDSYNRILWYKQTSRDMQLLGFRFAGSSTLEEGAKVEIGGGANKGETCTLTIKEHRENSSGVYFCAASLHSASRLWSSVQKPPDL